MPLLNYTTQINVNKTVGEIQRILAKHGARSILTDYDRDGEIEALAFQVLTPHGEVSIRLPVDAKAVFKILERQNVPPRYANHPQAMRIAWRILKDWTEAQMALLETEMVRMEQIFLPYVITSSGQTVYQRMVETKFQITRREGN